jgi:hypothetical protein
VPSSSASSSCFIFDSSPRSLSGTDLSSFLVATWCSNPDLIPTVVRFSILEPVEPFRERELPLFLHASEIIHLSYGLLHYRAIISVLEVHDFNTPPSNDCDGGSGDSSNEEYHGYNPSRGFLNSWLATQCFISGVDPFGAPWSSLPATNRGVSWSAVSNVDRMVAVATSSWSCRQVGQ